MMPTITKVLPVKKNRVIENVWKNRDEQKKFKTLSDPIGKFENIFKPETSNLIGNNSETITKNRFLTQNVLKPFSDTKLQICINVSSLTFLLWKSLESRRISKSKRYATLV